VAGYRQAVWYTPLKRRQEAFFVSHGSRGITFFVTPGLWGPLSLPKPMDSPLRGNDATFENVLLRIDRRAGLDRNDLVLWEQI
jgi:hypothetical protein